MKKLLLLMVAVTFTLKIDAESACCMRGVWIVNNLFSINSCAGLPSVYQHELGQLLTQILNQSIYQDVYSARKAAENLDLDIKARIDALEKVDESKKIALETSIFIIKQQQNSLNEQANLLEKKLSFKDKIYGFLNNILMYIRKIFGSAEAFTLSDTASKIYNYARFEREQLFINYQATLEWFSVQKTIGFPILIYFWKKRKIHHELICRLKKQSPHIQLLAELLDAGGQELIDIAAGDTLETLETAETNVDEAIAAGMADVFTSTATSGIGGATTSTVMETDIDIAISNAASEAPAGSVEAQALEDLDSAVKSIIASPSSGASVLSKIWDGMASIKNSLVDAYKGSFVGKVTKFIGDTYDQFIEAPYKKFIYDNIIAPLENNPLNKGLSALPHYLKMPIDTLIQLCTMQGGGLAASWASSANAKIFQADAVKNTAIGSDFEAFSKMLNMQQAIVQTTGQNSFYNALSGYIANQKAISDVTQTQLNIISKFLLQQSSQASYTNQNTYIFDQQFYLSPMYNTPQLSIPKQSTSSPVLPFLGKWYNPFRVGNWECLSSIVNNQTAYTFYQVPPVVPLDAPTVAKPDPAFSSAIFTEYYPQTSSSYQISVNIGVLSVTYPFFIGVIFNNARWISGVSDRYRQQRFAGLYGAVDGTVYLVVIESLVSSVAQIASGLPSMQSPFYLVATTPPSSFATAFTQKVIIPTPSSLLTSPLAIPGKYTISIITEPTQATVVLTDETPKEPVTFKLVKKNLNANIFNFHGIGLISAGASSSFVIEKPYALGLSTPISQ